MLKKFLKENMYRIMRVLVNQVGIMIFAIIMTFTAGVMQEDLRASMTTVASLFSIGFYLFLVFYTMREEGSRDSVKIEGGRLAYRPGYGFKVGLCATAPNYVFVFLMLLGLVLGVSVDAEGALLDTAGRGVWTVGYSIITMIQSMYTGVLKAIFTGASAYASVVGATVAYLITPLFAPVAAGLGYMYGCRNPVRRRS
ncbi:MAG: hypothetical protein J6V07_00690 [Clostridia bacterium]|nr:hypothetical protein [Clostridia bacterium]